MLINDHKGKCIVPQPFNLMLDINQFNQRYNRHYSHQAEMEFSPALYMQKHDNTQYKLWLKTKTASLSEE